MLIVGQSKTAIANLDNVEAIAIDDADTFRNIVAETSTARITLAEYDTKEETLEVFNSIILAYTEGAKVYTMPN